MVILGSGLFFWGHPVGSAVKMKVSPFAVVAALLLSVCVAEDDSHWVPGDSIHSGRPAASTLTKLRSAVKNIERLADEVDAVLRRTDAAGQAVVDY